MVVHMKLPTFKGASDEYVERLWFIVDAVWTIQNVNADSIKRVQLAMVFKGCVLDWFMGYLAQNTDPTVNEIKDLQRKKKILTTHMKSRADESMNLLQNTYGVVKTLGQTQCGITLAVEGPTLQKSLEKVQSVSNWSMGILEPLTISIKELKTNMNNPVPL